MNQISEMAPTSTFTGVKAREEALALHEALGPAHGEKTSKEDNSLGEMYKIRLLKTVQKFTL